MLSFLSFVVMKTAQEAERCFCPLQIISLSDIFISPLEDMCVLVPLLLLHASD